MSREFKFRVWDKQKKCFLVEWAIYWYDAFKGLRKNLIAEQYTGLKDKNGEEIYEGDVCRLTYYTKSKKERKWHKHLEDINVVEFEDGYFKFSNKDKYGIGSELSFSDYGEWSTADGSYKYEAEIIGNIHKEIKKC